MRRKLATNALKQETRPAPIFQSTDSRVLDNKDHFTIQDIEHGRNALARVSQYKTAPKWFKGTLTELVRIVKTAVKKKYPSIKVT